MRIVLTDETRTKKIGLITSLRELCNRFPENGWLDDPSAITDDHLRRFPARVSQETPPPTLAEYGERAVDDDARQPDGTWQQTWTIQPTVTLAEAKQLIAVEAIRIYWKKVRFDDPTVQELTTNNADAAAIEAARVAKYRPTLNQVRTGIQNATTVAEVYTLYKQIRDAS